MAWIYLCVFYISLFQMSVRSFGVIPAVPQRSERSAGHKTNGSYKIVNRYGKPFVNKRVPAADGAVVFPGLTSRSGVDWSLQIPEECQRIGICDYAPSNKDDIVESIIQDFQRRNKTFNSDVTEAPQIAERIGPVDENMELCTSTEMLYFPKLAKDSNNEWHRIINTDASPQQRFRIEICKGKPNAPCSSLAYFQDGYQARCIQKYMLRQMVALSDNNEVIEKAFMVPTCCSCVVSSV